MNFQTLLSQASKGTKQEKAPPFSRLKPTTLKTTVTQLSVAKSEPRPQPSTTPTKKVLTDEQSEILTAKTTLVADRERYGANVQKLLNPKDPLLSINLLRL